MRIFSSRSQTHETSWASLRVAPHKNLGSPDTRMVSKPESDPSASTSQAALACAIESVRLCASGNDEEHLFRALEAARKITAILVDRVRGVILDSTRVTIIEMEKAELSDAGSHSPKRYHRPSLPPPVAEEGEIGTRLAAR
jgi:hypothetical protein